MAANSSQTSPVYCGCGCGEPVNPKSTFRQGHDQRLVGQLALWSTDATIDVVTRTRMGLPDDINDQDIVDRFARVSDAIARMFSPQLANKYYSAAERRWDKVGKGNKSDPTAYGQTKDTVGDMPKAVAPSNGEPTVTQLLDARVLGASVRVKVGRWEYDAIIHGMSQSGKVTAVRYYKKGSDQATVKTDGQFQLISG